MSVFCTNCGTELRSGAKFCSRCGAAVSDAVVNVAAPDELERRNGSFQTSLAPPREASSPSARASARWILIGGPSILLAFAIGSWTMVSRRPSSPPELPSVDRSTAPATAEAKVATGSTVAEVAADGLNSVPKLRSARLRSGISGRSDTVVISEVDKLGKLSQILAKEGFFSLQPSYPDPPGLVSESQDLVELEYAGGGSFHVLVAGGATVPAFRAVQRDLCALGWELPKAWCARAGTSPAPAPATGPMPATLEPLLVNDVISMRRRDPSGSLPFMYAYTIPTSGPLDLITSGALQPNGSFERGTRRSGVLTIGYNTNHIDAPPVAVMVTTDKGTIEAYLPEVRTPVMRGSVAAIFYISVTGSAYHSRADHNYNYDTNGGHSFPDLTPAQAMTEKHLVRQASSETQDRAVGPERPLEFLLAVGESRSDFTFTTQKVLLYEGRAFAPTVTLPTAVNQKLWISVSHRREVAVVIAVDDNKKGVSFGEQGNMYVLNLAKRTRVAGPEIDFCHTSNALWSPSLRNLVALCSQEGSYFVRVDLQDYRVARSDFLRPQANARRLWSVRGVPTWVTGRDVLELNVDETCNPYEHPEDCPRDGSVLKPLATRIVRLDVVSLRFLETP